MSELEINAENIHEYRFFKRRNGQIVWVYDNFGPDVQNLEEGEDIIAFPKSAGFPLPETWYFSNSCPSYILVKDIRKFDSKGRIRGKYYNVDTEAITEGNTVFLKFTIKHSSYRYIPDGGELGPQDVEQLEEAVIPEGVENVSGTAEIEILGEVSKAECSNGIIETAIDNYSGEETVSGYIKINNMNLYFSTNITLPEESMKKRAQAEFVAERNRILSSLDWVVIRHITQLNSSSKETTLSAEQFTQLSDYMQKLRDMDETVEDFRNIKWPEAPDFVSVRMEESNG